MLAAVVADSRRRTYALFGHDEFGFWARANVAFGQGSRSFPPIPARQTRCAPLPLVGRGWGWGSLFGATSVRHRIPPSSTRGEGADRVCGSSIVTDSHAGPMRSIIAASFGCGARRMAAAPAAASGCETWRE